MFVRFSVLNCYSSCKLLTCHRMIIDSHTYFFECFFLKFCSAQTSCELIRQSTISRFHGLIQLVFVLLFLPPRRNSNISSLWHVPNARSPPLSVLCNVSNEHMANLCHDSLPSGGLSISWCCNI